MDADLKLLYRTYDAFNARDVEAVLATMTFDVDWPNGMMGGRMQGREAVRKYWQHQWSLIDPIVQPQGFTRLPDGRLRLEVRQTVRDMEGHLLSEGQIGHVYSFRDGLICRMEIES